MTVTKYCVLLLLPLLVTFLLSFTKLSFALVGIFTEIDSNIVNLLQYVHVRYKSVCLSPVVYPSVVWLKRSCALLSRLKFSVMFLYAIWNVGHPLISVVKFHGDRPREAPPSRVKRQRDSQI